jgi:hypothetical protein
LVTLVPASGALLTDATGVAQFKISPSSVSASGAIAVTASSTVSGGTAVTKTMNLQTSPGTVALSGLTVSPVSVQKGQAVNATVTVQVNGFAASSNSVAVAFTSNCGVVSPASALVDATGTASVVVQTNLSGSCNLSATSSGSNTVTSTFAVTEPPIAALLFQSATPSVIYQKDSPGVSTSIVKFKLVDTLGDPVQGATVDATLSNTDGGINFCNGPSSGPTGSNGEVNFSVCGGTLPATLVVNAQATYKGSVVSTNSNKLTIQAGIASQRFFSMSSNQLNYYVGGQFTSKFDGKTTTINVYLADRMANPVPDGTPVIFVAEGGQLNTGGTSSCILAGGGCSVQLIGQNYRPLGSAVTGADPRPGRVTVLAYADGEESFTDLNNNNRYDTGEPFEELGRPFIDRDEDGVYNNSYKNLQIATDSGDTSFPLPVGVEGTATCATNLQPADLSVASTCNGVWDAHTKVRRSIVIVFSGGEILQPGNYDASIPLQYRTKTLAQSTGSITVLLADGNGNPLPADASVGADVINPNSNDCAATLLGSVIGNTTEPTVHTATLSKCDSSNAIQFKVTVGDKVSSYTVAVP